MKKGICAWTKELLAAHGVNRIAMETVFQTLILAVAQTKKYVVTLVLV